MRVLGHSSNIISIFRKSILAPQASGFLNPLVLKELQSQERYFVSLYKNKTRTVLSLYINSFNRIHVLQRMTCICSNCSPGSADPDGGVDAAAPPADPAAHLRLPNGATQ